MKTFDPLFDVSGRVVVVTGGTGILCGAMARALAERGARVAVLGRDAEKAQAFVHEMNQNGVAALGFVADVLDEAALLRVREAVLAEWGRIDVLINGAGGAGGGAVIAPDQNFFEHVDMEQFRRVEALNFEGTVLPSKVFGEVMARQGSGSIINISSMTAAQAVTRVVAYSTAKAAVDAFTRWLAVESALKFGAGIRVNAIAPGFFLTTQNRALLTRPDGTPTERAASVLRKTPAGRFGEPEELIGACIWLCSDASSFVTGTVIPVDGGFSAWSGV